ncbi:DUF2752 domain-containing protein [Sunxiuqinia elliptica]|uniref:DUF2752 domain-containing protein n=1 Tax=Sunxiuqinia elliptica TaxID=655355 RepID=UPI001BAEFE94
MLQLDSWQAKIKWIVISLLLGFIVLNYWSYNPETTNHFPSCPFKLITGYKCAGCGSQRAIHHLLHLNIGRSFKSNPLLIISLPYILMGIYLDLKKNPSPKILQFRKSLYGTTAIFLILTIIIGFWIIRNICDL